MGFANNIIPPAIVQSMLDNPQYCEICDNDLALDRLIRDYNICAHCDEILEERCNSPTVTCTVEELFKMLDEE